MRKVFGLCVALFHVSLSAAPFCEVYWEAWNMTNESDYGSQITKLDVCSPGSGSGINIVDIAFGDYRLEKMPDGKWSLGYVNEQVKADGQIFTPYDLRAAVDYIHDRGGKVKISFGGATFSMDHVIKTLEDADLFARNLKELIDQTKLDGVDFDVEDGITSANIQIELLRKCRSYLGPGALISLTIPALAELHEPYASVVSAGHQYLSAINIMAYDVYWQGYDAKSELESIVSMGIPRSKIVWGIMPGKQDDPDVQTSVDDAKNIAQYVKEKGFGGVMIWDVNRDTDHRTGYSPGSNLQETGLPDGTYVNAVSAILARSNR